MIKKLHDDLFSNDDIIVVNGDSNYVTFLVMEWVFIVLVLIILGDLVMLILINMILKLLFKSGLGLGVT